MGVREVLEDGAGAPYIGCAGRFLGLEARPLAALLEVCLCRCLSCRHPPEISETCSSYIGSYIRRTCLQAPSLTL